MAMVFCFDLMVWMLTCDPVPTQRTSALTLLEFDKLAAHFAALTVPASLHYIALHLDGISDELVVCV